MVLVLFAAADLFAAASPFTFTVSAEPQLPCTNYAQCAGFEDGMKGLRFAPACRPHFDVTNVTYEGKSALWTKPAGALSVRTLAHPPAGSTNRLAVTVKLGPEHVGGDGIGLRILVSEYADAASGGKKKPRPLAGIGASWEADSTAGWLRIEGEPFVLPPDATDLTLLLGLGSLPYCKAGGFVDNVYCGPAWTELSFTVENHAGLAQVLVEDENGKRVFCDDAFPENLTKYEKRLRVSAAMRYRIRAVDREARADEKWYPSPRPQKAAAKTSLSAVGRKRFWMPSAREAVFDVSLVGEAELSGASLEAVVRDAVGKEVSRRVVSPVLMRTAVSVPLAGLAEGRHLFTATFREKTGRVVALETPVDFWKIPEKTSVPKDVYTIRDRNIYRNGKFFFPIVTWGGAPAWETLRDHRFDTNAFFRCYHRRLEDQRKLGFNTIIATAKYYPDVARAALTNEAHRTFFAAWDSYKQIAQLPFDFPEAVRLHAEHGLAMVPYLHIWHPAKADEVDAWLPFALRWREADNLLCWHLSDEMDGGVENNLLLNQNHHEVDPDRLTWINFISGSYQNRHTGDILSEDPYPVPNQTLAKVTWHAGKMDGFIRPDQSMFLWIQMFGGEGSWTRSPTFEELKAMVVMSLNHGVRGIAYFNYEPSVTGRDGIRSMTVEDYAKLGPFNRLLAERAHLWCLGKNLSRTFDDKTRMDAAVFRRGGSVWVSVVNSEPKDARFRIGLPDGMTREGRAEVVDENRTVAFRDGVIEEDFPPLAVRLYRIK